VDRTMRWVPQPIDPGTRVEVYNTFSSSWVRGFEVATRHDARYQLRRLSDGVVLPAEFANQDVRRQRR
jgi:hypothetical protein